MGFCVSDKEPKCKYCQHSEFDVRSILLWCAKHGESAYKPCDDFVREPGTEGDE